MISWDHLDHLVEMKRIEKLFLLAFPTTDHSRFVVTAKLPHVLRRS